MPHAVSRSPQQKPKLVKGLLIVFTLTLVSSFGMALLSNMTGGFSAVVDRDQTDSA